MTNLDRWNACQIKPNKQASFDKVAQRLLANKARYQSVEKRTGVPWWFIAVVHYREASCNWNTQLGQGDPLNRVSTHVPKGRGPFATWEDGAFDALVKTAPYAARNKDWTIGSALDFLEKYNGLGYRRKGVPSPYLWAGTNQYTSGKYVSDGVYSANTVDTQLGCAGLLKAMGIGTSKIGVEHMAPAATIMAGMATMWQHVMQHPYMAAGAAMGVGMLIYLIIKFLKGK